MTIKATCDECGAVFHTEQEDANDFLCLCPECNDDPAMGAEGNGRPYWENPADDAINAEWPM